MKKSRLLEIIREEIIKEITVTSMAKGNIQGGSEPLLQAIKDELELDENDLGKADFNTKYNVIFFPNGEYDDLFATWTKPNTSIIVNNQTLSSNKWEEYKSKLGKPFYIYED